MKINKNLLFLKIIVVVLWLISAHFICQIGPSAVGETILKFSKAVGICQHRCDFLGPYSQDIFMGLFFLVLSILLSVYTHFKSWVDTYVDRHYLSMLRILIGVLVLLSFFMAINKSYAHDEYEHIHCAWLLKENSVPYRDFFENHHPLLWIMLMPFILLSQDTVWALTLSRLVMFGIFLCTVYLTFHITHLLTRSMQKSLAAIIFLVSMELFVFYGIEIRPDNAQLMFMLLSLYTLLKYLESRKMHYIALSGSLLSISFLFLQKAIFPILGITIGLRWFKKRGELNHASLLIFSLCFFIPIILFMGYLISHNALKDYWISAWLFNQYHFKASTATNLMYTAYSINPYIVGKAEIMINRYNLFWIFSIFGCVYILGKRKFSFSTKFMPLLALFIWLPIFLIRDPYAQYFIPAIPLFCIANGIVLCEIFENLRMKSSLRLFIFACMIFIPSIAHTRLAMTPATHIQKKMLTFVLNNSQRSDYIYDGDIRFNLFNPDVHYLWYYLSPYGWGKGLTLYNETSNGRFKNYDICELIRKKEPQIVSNHALDLKKCGLDDKYFQTEFKGIYLRHSSKIK